VEVLPERSTDGARDPYKVMEAPQFLPNGGIDQIRITLDTAPRTHPPFVQKFNSLDVAPHHHPSKSGIADEDVRPMPKEKVGDLEIVRRSDGADHLLWGTRAREVVRGSTDMEGGKGSERSSGAKRNVAEPRKQLLVEVRVGPGHTCGMGPRVREGCIETGVKVSPFSHSAKRGRTITGAHDHDGIAPTGNRGWRGPVCGSSLSI
jgi:hypothetical protein